MMRLAGLEVNECAKFLAKRPTIDHYDSIFFLEPKYRFPLALVGITWYIPTHIPSAAEMNNLELEHITLLEIICR